jgi:hypothetical protein
VRAWIALALVVLALAGFGLVETGMVELPKIGRTTAPMQPAPSVALPGVKLKSLSSQTGFLQGSFVVSNTNAFPIANAAIHCDVHGPDETVLQTFDFVVDEPVPANGQTTITDHKFGFWPQQDSHMRCRAVSVERR